MVGIGFLALAVYAVGVVTGLTISFIAWALAKEDDNLNEEQKR